MTCPTQDQDNHHHAAVPAKSPVDSVESPNRDYEERLHQLDFTLCFPLAQNRPDSSMYSDFHKIFTRFSQDFHKIAQLGNLLHFQCIAEEMSPSGMSGNEAEKATFLQRKKRNLLEAILKPTFSSIKTDRRSSDISIIVLSILSGV